MQPGLSLAALASAIATIAFSACATGPGDAELDRLHDEAVKANAAAMSAKARTEDVEGFDLEIAGQLKKPMPSLSWVELQQLGQTHVKTVNALDPSAPDRVVDFRGVLVRDIVDKIAPLPAAKELTVIALDGFRATIDLADVKKWNILLAIAADNKPISRTMGGPIALVFPYSESPESRVRYSDRYWGFYVQALVVGTEPLKLKVGGQRFDRAALESLPTSTYDGPVGWKVDWPADGVQLRGVRITDVLAAAHVTIPDGGRVIVRGKAWLDRNPKEPIAIDGADLEKCQPMLALRWGPDDVRIPARLGGPIAMVMPEQCASRYGERYWMSFVDELYVETK